MPKGEAVSPDRMVRRSAGRSRLQSGQGWMAPGMAERQPLDPGAERSRSEAWDYDCQPKR